MRYGRRAHHAAPPAGVGGKPHNIKAQVGLARVPTSPIISPYKDRIGGSVRKK